MNKTGIEYLTHTWNPIKMRCDRVSPGCTNCWHLTVCENSINNPNIPEKLKDVYRGGSFYLDEKELVSPLKSRNPAMIGVQFMGDLFHDSVPFAWLIRIWTIMVQCPHHTFIILTKRAKQMLEWYQSPEYAEIEDGYPVCHIWPGVSVENQQSADERIRHLVEIPVGPKPLEKVRAKRLVSVEPMLGPIEVPDDVLRNLDWVIIGAESGPNRRQCSLEWVSRLGILCNCAAVPWFVKQIHDINGKLVKSPANWPREFPI